MPKMKSGYAVRIDGFIAVDPKNLDSLTAGADAVKAAIKGNLSAILPQLKDVTVHQAFVRRRTEEEPPAPAAPATEPPAAQGEASGPDPQAPSEAENVLAKGDPRPKKTPRSLAA